MYQYIIKAVVSLALSVALLFLSEKLEQMLLKKREIKAVSLGKRYKSILAILFVALCVLAAVRETPEKAAYLIVMLFLAMLVTVMDWKYRIIPNDLLLMLIAIQTAALLLGIVSLQWWSCLLGLCVSAVLFLIPSILGRNVGAGDVKLAAAVGFCVGMTDTLYVIVLMGAMILLYSYLKTMNLRLALQKYVPMGPFISTAFVIILLK